MMSAEASFWGLSLFFWTMLMSFFSMQEMACISFNRLRLEIAIRGGSKRARWIKHMLDNPVLLFGTTLCGVNVALVIESESARRFFSALGINPNFSAIVNAPWVLIVGGLVPMFAARLYPEHMAKLGIPLLWVASKILSPIIFCFDYCFQKLRSLFQKEPAKAAHPRLQRDELRELLEERKRSYYDEIAHETLASRVFTLREKPVSDIMIPISQYPIFTSSIPYKQAQELLSKSKTPLALIQNKKGQIIGYIRAWDLVGDNSISLGSLTHQTTFIAEEMNAIDLLLRLKKEGSHIAFVIDSQGAVSGVLTLEDVVNELLRDTARMPSLTHIEKTVPADKRLDAFMKTYQLALPSTSAETFGDLVEELLGHKPSPGDILRFGPLEITVKEVSIRGAKTLFVETLD